MPLVSSKTLVAVRACVYSIITRAMFAAWARSLKLQKTCLLDRGTGTYLTSTVGRYFPIAHAQQNCILHNRSNAHIADKVRYWQQKDTSATCRQHVLVQNEEFEDSEACTYCTAALEVEANWQDKLQRGHVTAVQAKAMLPCFHSGKG